MHATATPTHRVGRPFDGLGRRFDTGTLVDTADWPATRVRQLVDQRYLKPLQPHEVIALAAPSDSDGPKKSRT